MKRFVLSLALLASLVSCSLLPRQRAWNPKDWVMISGRITDVPGRLVLIEGPLIDFADAYYRFPETGQEYMAYVEEEYAFLFNRRELKRINQGIRYEVFGEDSCIISGGCYRDKEYVFYDTPANRWRQVYRMPSDTGWKQREHLSQLSYHYSPAFFDAAGRALDEERHQALSSALEDAMKAVRKKFNTVLLSRDTLTYRVFLTYVPARGLSPLIEGQMDGDAWLCFREGSTVPLPGEVEPLCRDFFLEVEKACDTFSKDHPDLARFIFMTAVKFDTLK